jgi:hypothetical protein
MQRKRFSIIASCVLAGVCTSHQATAAPPWQAIIPFRKVEADPNKAYLLTENHGPWLIMCRSFAGENAAHEAQALVLELRQRYKLTAYVYQQQYDFTKKEIGRGFDRYGRPKVMEPNAPAQFTEVAVLVGDFNDADDPRAEHVLQTLKKATPKCLDLRSVSDKEKDKSSQRFWGLRNSGKDGKGPMRLAFLTRNPKLPEEYFAPKGIDPLVKKMNADHKFSLLTNPGAFSVRIATFRGDSTTTIKTKEIERLENENIRQSKLEEGALKAEALASKLREEGIEAYVFHDVHESMVTVGSFDTVGEPRPDGKIEMNPAVHQLIEHFKAQPTPRPGQPATFGPRKLHGISLDVQPMPVAVPRESLGSQYARRRE